jgi:hypothetical protein
MMSDGELAQRLRHVDRMCRFGWFQWRGQKWYVGVEEYGTGDTAWELFNFWTEFDEI